MSELLGVRDLSRSVLSSPPASLRVLSPPKGVTSLRAASPPRGASGLLMIGNSSSLLDRPSLAGHGPAASSLLGKASKLFESSSIPESSRLGGRSGSLSAPAPFSSLSLTLSARQPSETPLLVRRGLFERSGLGSVIEDATAPVLPAPANNHLVVGAHHARERNFSFGEISLNSPTSSKALKSRLDDEEVSLKLDSYESFEKKMERHTCDENTQTQWKLLRDQMSHFAKELAELQHEMKGLGRREETLQAGLALETKQRPEFERQISSIESKERQHTSALEAQARDLQRIAEIQASDRKHFEEALERGLKGLHQMLEKGLEEEVNQRTDQNRLASQSFAAAFEKRNKERDDDLKTIRQEREDASRVMQEALQAQHREIMEHMAIERQLHDEAQRSAQDGFHALDVKLQTDVERHAKDFEAILNVKIYQVQAVTEKHVRERLENHVKDNSEAMIALDKKVGADIQRLADNLRADFERALVRTKETLEEAVQKEQRTRSAGEERFDKACTQMRRDFAEAMNEAHTTLRADLDSTSKGAKEFVEEVHKAFAELDHMHKGIVKDVQEELGRDLQKLADAHEQKHGEMRTALESSDKAHHAKLVHNISVLEENVSSLLGSTHKKLVEELQTLKDGVDASHGSLRHALEDVAQHVDGVALTVQEERKSRRAVEERLEKSMNELRRDLTSQHLSKVAGAHGGPQKLFG